MARATRRRTIAAPRAEVWELVSDPYSLPRWWPRTARVENVEGDPGSEGSQWTSVLSTAEGRGVRADFRCRESIAAERYAWEQLISGSPFERHTRRYGVAASLEDDGEGTLLSLDVIQALRGVSRLGSPMMRRGQGALLDEALDGVERALGGGG
jgi:uncharacterized protein YndB with AHSA1/START domain